MLWNLLIVTCFFTAVVSAWDAVVGVPQTLSGHILTAVIGVAIGAACAFTMWWVAETIGTRASKLQSESHQKWLIRAIFASSIFWISLAAVLGRWASLTVLRIV
jgi:hypothetical protein